MASPPPNLETTQSFEFHHGASYPRPGSVGNASSATLGLADIPNPNGSFYPLAAGNHSLETAAATPAGTSKPLPLPNGTHATMPPQSSLTTDTPTLQSQPPNLPLPPVPQPGNESHDHIDLATLRTQLSLIDDDTASPAQKLVGFQVAVYDKLTERLDSFNKSMKHKTTHLLAINQHLNHGEELVEKEKRQLLSMQRKIENNIGVLESKHEELQRQESIIEKLPPPDPTTIFRGKQPAYEQLFDLVADDNAIEDTIYYLGKALSLGKIELTLYLKLVRSLAHDQFMCRTLIQKIRHQAQLPPA
ncbi:suppressor protein stp22 of temperature-sensitive alpha-factor receptor and arginine permease [Dimargaris xerosporica]|nr:suppressor protein stp22 of temperature-sensitive alpha-factor receptor and arginine permease [Dimargaris xerosporica]